MAVRSRPTGLSEWSPSMVRSFKVLSAAAQSPAANRGAGVAVAAVLCAARQTAAADRACVRTRRPAFDLQLQSFAEVVLAGFRIAQHLLRVSMAKHLAAADHIAAIRDLQRLAGRMIRDQDRDTLALQIADDHLNAVDGHRIDAGKRLVQ